MKLSIITINYNNCDGLKKTIESVFCQSYNDFEYIVVDGGSIDGSREYIIENENGWNSKWKNEVNINNFIFKWISEPDNGIYNAMNKGIAIAKGEYCLFLNSGDTLNENILIKAIKECSGEDIIYFNTYLIYNYSNYEVLKYPSSLSMKNFYKTTIGHQSTFIKTKLFNKYGLYNESNMLHSDIEFWIKSIIIGNCSTKYVDLILSYYDMGGRSSKQNEFSDIEFQSILSRYLPKLVLEDYEYWYNKERESKILMWYKRHRFLYGLLVFFYRVVNYFMRLSKNSHKSFLSKGNALKLKIK